MREKASVGAGMLSLEDEKRNWRVTMRQRRAAIALPERATAAVALVEIWRRERPVLTPHPDGRPATIAGFWPKGDEIDVCPLLTALHDDGYAVALPATPAEAGPLAFRVWTPASQLATGAFGVSEPAPDAAPAEPDALLIPLLAVDLDGYRLGYGGGYYDRTLDALRARGRVIAIGVAYETQRIERLPRGAHDHRLDWLLTEKRLLAFV
jgi:5-formyltetrahydrofolate cyclo-ligase